MRKARIACIQYQLRPITDFKAFADQVTFFVDSAEDYGADFVLLPEFFTTQLMSFLPEREPVNAIRHLAEYTEPISALLAKLAQRFGVHIIGGTHPNVVDGRLYNTSFFIYPDGRIERQDKVHLTPTEKEYWRMEAGEALSVFETDKGRVAIAICYDSEFPELVRRYADAGAEILFVPFCTDDRQGYLRVYYSAQARCIENQMYVALTGTVGNLPRVAYMATHYGRASILTPSDFMFSRDGIAAEGDAGQEMLVVADVDLDLIAEARERGSVRNFKDRRPQLYDGEVVVKGRG